MHDLPHRYTVSASSSVDGEVAISSDGLADVGSMPPPEFGGPGGYWSPETLLVAAVADCFVLSFRAIARVSRLEWQSLDCKVEGKLDRVDRVMRFTRFDVTAALTVPGDVDVAKAKRLLKKAEQACLITNSLIAESRLSATVSSAN